MLQKNMKNVILLTTIFVIISVILSACGPKEPALDIDAQKTGFAQTAEIQATMTAQAQPTATQTQVPTATYTPTPELTATPLMTSTEQGEPTATQIASTGVDAAAWLANDPPDNTKFNAGQEFTVTWTLENTGSSTWTTDFYIKFTFDQQMGAPEQVFLPYPVPPGTNVQISVDFIAPETEGEKRSEWKLYNANDVGFYDFYIVIEVVAAES
jgi:hypothetical protein